MEWSSPNPDARLIHVEIDGRPFEGIRVPVIRVPPVTRTAGCIVWFSGTTHGQATEAGTEASLLIL